MIKALKVSLLAFVIAGCSSPPPPTPVEWDKKDNAMNSTLPQWGDNHVIVPAETVKGKWTTMIHAVDFNEVVWTPAVYYAVAHSTRVVITAPSSEDYFNTKAWLRQHGAKGVIEYQPLFNCLACRETGIYFSH
ncbi:Cag pathogenicity island protein Cag12 [Salmonella enterica]